MIDFDRCVTSNDFESCFGIRIAINDDKLICEGCRRAVQEHTDWKVVSSC